MRREGAWAELTAKVTLIGAFRSLSRVVLISDGLMRIVKSDLIAIIR